MKTLGIIGGLGPESTIDYYQKIIALYRERTGDGSYPEFIINSIDLRKGLDFMDAKDLAGMAGYLVEAIGKLAQVGADFGLISANTPHIVFDDVAPKSPIPLISIVRATAERATALGLKKVGLFGTGFTMRASFYPGEFQGAGIAMVIPTESERDLIHRIYIGELLKNRFLPQSREAILRIAHRMKAEDGVQAIVLAGTELPLLLRDAGAGIDWLDTTVIHVEAVVDELLR